MEDGGDGGERGEGQGEERMKEMMKEEEMGRMEGKERKEIGERIPILDNT